MDNYSFFLGFMLGAASCGLGVLTMGLIGLGYIVITNGVSLGESSELFNFVLSFVGLAAFFVFIYYGTEFLLPNSCVVRAGLTCWPGGS